MTNAAKWCNAVVIVRGSAIDAQIHGPEGTGRATAFDFEGTGAQRTWTGRVSVAPGANTGAHHHGRQEVLVFVINGRTEIRWGDGLEFAAEIGVGDFAYFAPYVPHQERNLSTTNPVELLVVRSDNERIAVALEVEVAPRPEWVK